MTDRESKGDAPDRITLLVAERDAALAECERLRNDLRLVKGAAARVRDRLTVERDRYHDCVDLDRLQADY